MVKYRLCYYGYDNEAECHNLRWVGAIFKLNATCIVDNHLSPKSAHTFICHRITILLPFTYNFLFKLAVYAYCA